MPSVATTGKNSSDQLVECALHRVAGMTFDPEQTEVLRDILEAALQHLRIESARTDSHDYREKLHHRERVVESLLGAPELRH